MRRLQSRLACIVFGGVPRQSLVQFQRCRLRYKCDRFRGGSARLTKVGSDVGVMSAPSRLTSASRHDRAASSRRPRWSACTQPPFGVLTRQQDLQQPRTRSGVGMASASLEKLLHSGSFTQADTTPEPVKVSHLRAAGCQTWMPPATRPRSPSRCRRPTSAVASGKGDGDRGRPT